MTEPRDFDSDIIITVGAVVSTPTLHESTKGYSVLKSTLCTPRWAIQLLSVCGYYNRKSVISNMSL